MRGGSYRGSVHLSAHGYAAGQQQPRRQLPMQHDGTVSLLDAAADLQEQRWGQRVPPPRDATAAQSKAGAPTAEAAHAAAALAAPAVPSSPGRWGGSQQHGTAAQQQQQQQLARRHSGAPGAPVSPHPSVPPSLRRVSSQPQTALPSGSSCSAATGSTPAHASGGGSTSLEGSRSSRHSGTSGAGAPLPGQGSTAVAAAAAGASAKPAAQQRKARAAAEQPGGEHMASPPPPMRYHPSLGGPWQADGAHGAFGAKGPDQAPLSHLPVSLVSVAAAAAAAAADEEDDCLLSPTGGLQRSGSAQSVSLLTFMLKGPSAASSLAASRETSVRSGVARSREASVRSGSRR